MTNEQKRLLLAIWLTNERGWRYLKLYEDKVRLLRRHIYDLDMREVETIQRGGTWEESIAAGVKLAMGKPHPILAKWGADRQSVPELAITWRNNFHAPDPSDPCYHRKHFQARVEANKLAIWLALTMEELSANDKSNNDTKPR